MVVDRFEFKPRIARMPASVCPICKTRQDDIDKHVEETHSDPDQLYQGMPESEYIVKALAGGFVEEETAEPPVTDVPALDALGELGVKADDIATVTVSTQTGAVCTATEAKRVLDAVGECVGFVFDRSSFVVNFIDWGIRTGFAEELAEAGGFTIVSDSSQQHEEKYMKMSVLHAHVVDFLGNEGTGRSFTFRRLGRFLARSIPSIVDKNRSLKQFFVTGSPMSNRLGVPPVDFLAVTSIFEYIKPYQKWSDSERRAWHAHNRSVVKVANSQNVSFLPTDLRPSPSQAETFASEGTNDFGVRHGQHHRETYGAGARMFDRMIAQTEAKRKQGEGLGFLG